MFGDPGGKTHQENYVRPGKRTNKEGPERMGGERGDRGKMG